MNRSHDCHSDNASEHHHHSATEEVFAASSTVPCNPVPAAPFFSYEGLLSGALITQLADAVRGAFDAKEKRKDEKYSEGQTFFIGCRDEPVDLIEGFALAVFRHYTAGVAHGNGAGAEWWPLVMESARADEVGLHFDKDYGREDDGDHRYPFLGTVSYLCGGGAPTLFLERCEGDKSPTIPRGFLSQVTPGKQVAFDGRFLHCAPADLVDAWGMHTMPKKKEPRITLLVNIWLHEKPLDAVRWAPPAVDGAVVVAAPPPPLPALHLVWPAPAPVPTLHVEPGRTLTRVRLKMDALTLQFALDCDIVATSGATCVELVWDAASGLCTLGKVAKKKAATAAKKASAPPKGGKKGKQRK